MKRIPLAWYLFFFVAPLLIVALTSFLTRGTYGGLVWELNVFNFVRIFDSIYLSIFWRSLVLALTTSRA